VQGVVADVKSCGRDVSHEEIAVGALDVTPHAAFGRIGLPWGEDKRNKNDENMPSEAVD